MNWLQMLRYMTLLREWTVTYIAHKKMTSFSHELPLQCLEKLLFWEKELWHISQKNDFSPSWTDLYMSRDKLHFCREWTCDKYHKGMASLLHELSFTCWDRLHFCHGEWTCDIYHKGYDFSPVMKCLHMFRQITLLREWTPTYITRKWFHFLMNNSYMAFQITLLRERFMTYIASNHALSRDCSFLYCH